MSSLIFHTNPEEALVATDSLVVDEDGSPRLFSSKAFFLPHLKTIVAGTGAEKFVAAWFLHVNQAFAVRGIEQLDELAPAALRDRWEDSHEDDMRLLAASVAVYHLGFSEDTGKMVAFAYRSDNDFVSEPLPHGTFANPDCQVPAEFGNVYDKVDTMMHEQRANEQKKEGFSRVHIGGHALAMHLTQTGCSFYTPFIFDDFEQQLAQTAASS